MITQAPSDEKPASGQAAIDTERFAQLRTEVSAAVDALIVDWDDSIARLAVRAVSRAVAAAIEDGRVTQDEVGAVTSGLLWGDLDSWGISEKGREGEPLEDYLAEALDGYCDLDQFWPRVIEWFGEGAWVCGCDAAGVYVDVEAIVRNGRYYPFTSTDSGEPSDSDYCLSDSYDAAADPDLREERLGFATGLFEGLTPWTSYRRIDDIGDELREATLQRHDILGTLMEYGAKDWFIDKAAILLAAATSVSLKEAQRVMWQYLRSRKYLPGDEQDALWLAWNLFLYDHSPEYESELEESRYRE